MAIYLSQDDDEPADDDLKILRDIDTSGLSEESPLAVVVTNPPTTSYMTPAINALDTMPPSYSATVDIQPRPPSRSADNRMALSSIRGALDNQSRQSTVTSARDDVSPDLGRLTIQPIILSPPPLESYSSSSVAVPEIIGEPVLVQGSSTKVQTPTKPQGWRKANIIGRR